MISWKASFVANAADSCVDKNFGQFPDIIEKGFQRIYNKEVHAHLGKGLVENIRIFQQDNYKSAPKNYKMNEMKRYKHNARQGNKETKGEKTGEKKKKNE